MKVFHCDHCASLLFFENVQCLHCARPVAYLPDLGVVGSLDATGDNLWQSPLRRAAGHHYRLCENYRLYNVCNWAVAVEDANSLCISCRLTRVIPDLSVPGNKEAWYRLEVAKRRLVYSLVTLGLPVTNKTEDPAHGLAYEFLDTASALTGHADGVITIHVAEADDAERERRRQSLHEPYRTLLGHFRHESGHYYWDRLIGDDQASLEAFRQRFGDERDDYAQALQGHYAHGPRADWQQQFVSAYASVHPWEDWAETWAHYIHLTDTLEMAATCGLSLYPGRSDEPQVRVKAPDGRVESFERMIEDWFGLTYLLNNLNRGLGLADAYPFVLSPPAIDKLRFVHETVIGAADQSKP